MAAKKQNTMERFFTLNAANDGKVLYLEELDGTTSSDWVKVRGADSDVYEEQLAKEREAFSSDNPKDVRMAVVRLYASLIVDWSFSTPCTFENACKLLHDSPFVRRQIIKFVDDRKAFFNAPAKA